MESPASLEQGNCACWWWSGCVLMAARNLSPRPTATANPQSRGLICCAIAADAALPRRCWRSGTARCGSGKRCARCPRPPGSNGAGAQAGQRPCRTAEIGTSPRARGDAGDL